jgi:phage shock protein C
VSDKRNDPRRDARDDARTEFQRSVERLEKAVQGFVSATNEHVTNRAADFVDDTAERLERELRSRRGQRDDDQERDASQDRYDSKRSRRERHREARWERRSRRRQARWQAMAGSAGYRTARVYQDKRRQKIAGVCAGIARYFGVEVWVVRCIAISGVIFMPQIVIPAYIVAAFVLPKAPTDEAAKEDAVVEKNRTDHSSPAPELGAQLSPRRSLRGVQADLDQIELKLRRMESHVTSGQFELQRELKRIDA